MFTENKALSFPLAGCSYAYQFTVHMNNLLNTFPSEFVLEEFKHSLHDDPEDIYWWMHEASSYVGIFGHVTYQARIRQLISHYGLDFCKQWFHDIYGWSFEQKAG